MSSPSPVAASTLSPSAVAEARRATAGGGPSADRLDGYGEQSFSFSDFLSIINPLQHIPVVGTIYRAITGDTISSSSKVIGGILFGGPMGLISSAFNAIVEETTGKDLGEQALALVMPGRGEPAPERGPQYATVTPPVPAPVAAPAALSGATAPEILPLAAAMPPAGPSLSPAAAVAAEPPGIPPAARGRILAKGAPTTAPAAHGRTLSDYRASAGHPMPVIDNTRAATNAATPVRLQTTLPLGERARASLTPPVREGGTAETPPVTPAAGSREAGEEPMEPFVAAMLRGLDRYRDMKQVKPAPAVLDATL